MIEGIELIVYTDDGKNQDQFLFDLTPIQTEVIFKALGIHVDVQKNEITTFSDSTLKKYILPKVNFVEPSS